MLSIFAQVLPLALAADISPSGLLFVMMILSMPDNGKKKSLSFVLGSTAFLAVLGTFIMLTVHVAAKKAGHPSRLSGLIDIALAFLILAIVAKSVLTKKKSEASPKKKKKGQTFFVLGFVYMIINISTLIPFIAAAKIIAAARLGLQSLMLLAAIVLISVFMVAFPVILTYVMPEKSKTILGPIQTFMRTRGKEIANIYFLIMAAYLLIHGILIFR